MQKMKIFILNYKLKETDKIEVTVSDSYYDLLTEAAQVAVEQKIKDYEKRDQKAVFGDMTFSYQVGKDFINIEKYCKVYDNLGAPVDAYICRLALFPMENEKASDMRKILTSL